MKKEIVIVDWIDSASMSGWESSRVRKKHFKEDMKIQSVGFVLKQTKKKLALVGSIDCCTTPNVNQYHEIPMSAVKKVRRIRMKSGRARG